MKRLNHWFCTGLYAGLCAGLMGAATLHAQVSTRNGEAASTAPVSSPDLFERTLPNGMQVIVKINGKTSKVGANKVTPGKKIVTVQVQGRLILNTSLTVK